ncbi:MAG TPA: wax ester/triacylglycerol synthase family O-acyltransferase [Candidatus Eisenbacteria bacterium]|nr:wax ester/triacylglycerol synthase family O-acyltransferase [Candidatus Eisenbacteria bacterium]
MAYVHAERLTALDQSFLAIEDATSHMHIGAVAIFEAAPLRNAAGGIDVDRIRTLMEAGIHRIPRYRQRLVYSPVFRHPVWVDDTRFNLAYHLRHTHLPRPGDERLLKRLAGRLMSQQLDRGKPLWEMWVVEGLEGDRFAIVTKVHHCMIDGVGSVELTGSVMRPTPDEDPRLAEPPPRWIPRPAPGPAQLFFNELCHRAAAPSAIARTIREAAQAPGALLRRASAGASGVFEAVSAGFRASSPTPLNVEIGPHRRFDWAATDLGAIREVKGRLGGTVNDVVLAVLSGALARFLYRRGVDPASLDFRAMLPVNVRAAGEHMGNRVAMIVARLPLAARDPRERLARVVAETTRAKGSHQALGMQVLEELSDRTFTTLFTEFARLAAMAQPYNIVVTNVPGPSFPVYVCGARMLACYPVVPLFQGQGLGVALFSYDGRVHWGFNADWDVLPDLHDVVDAVEQEVAALCDAAAVVRAATG